MGCLPLRQLGSPWRQYPWKEQRCWGLLIGFEHSSSYSSWSFLAQPCGVFLYAYVAYHSEQMQGPSVRVWRSFSIAASFLELHCVSSSRLCLPEPQSSPSHRSEITMLFAASFFFFFKYLLIWLCQGLVWQAVWQVGLSSLTGMEPGPLHWVWSLNHCTTGMSPSCLLELQSNVCLSGQSRDSADSSRSVGRVD